MYVIDYTVEGYEFILKNSGLVFLQPMATGRHVQQLAATAEALKQTLKAVSLSIHGKRRDSGSATAPSVMALENTESAGASHVEEVNPWDSMTEFETF